MGPIAKIPIGLLEVFDLRTLGNYPRVVGDSISPTFDITLLQYENSEVWTGQFTDAGASTIQSSRVLAPSAGLDAQVPATERWLVTRWSAYLSFNAVAAATAEVAHLGYSYEAGTKFVPFPIKSSPVEGAFLSKASPLWASAATSRTWLMSEGRDPFIMPAAAVPCVFFEGAGAVLPITSTITVAMNMEMIRIKN